MAYGELLAVNQGHSFWNDTLAIVVIDTKASLQQIDAAVRVFRCLRVNGGIRVFTNEKPGNG
jgi:hypothetical protein